MRDVFLKRQNMGLHKFIRLTIPTDLSFVLLATASPITFWISNFSSPPRGSRKQVAETGNLREMDEAREPFASRSPPAILSRSTFRGFPVESPGFYAWVKPLNVQVDTGFGERPMTIERPGEGDGAK